MRSVLIFAAGLGLAAAASTPYAEELRQWRADREARLKAPEGWLSVAGLFWLREGENVVGSDPLSDVVLPEGGPKRAGVFRMTHGVATFEPVPGAKQLMKPDDPGPPDVVRIGSIAMTVIVRGGKTGVRLRDPNAKTRREFSGCQWYPPAERLHFHAKWTPYASAKTIPIVNVLGMTSQEPAPGYAEFSFQGRKLRLEPITEDDHLFFLFKDSTSGRTTYGAGRFLYAPMPKDGTVDLDFNKAENPPCAFTAFATCPLPPKQNTLAVAIEAGEKTFGHH